MWLPGLLILGVVLAAVPFAAEAQGLDQAQKVFDDLATTLQTIAVAVATCALMWAAYSFFKGTINYTIIIAILVGCIVIGAAPEIAKLFLGK